MRIIDLFKMLFILAFIFFLIGIFSFVIVIIEISEVLINSHTSLVLKFILFSASALSFIAVLFYLKVKIRDLRRYK